MKVFISPMANDGILRVIEAQYRLLPKFGVEVTNNIHEADVICNHGSDTHSAPGIPSVHISHGMFWSRQPWGSGFMEINKELVESMHMAVAHTAPSEWVATAIRRGGYYYPETVLHGIFPEEFLPSKNYGKYILYNKARSDFVSDPGCVIQAAERMTQHEFVSTMGSNIKGYAYSKNIKITGALPHSQMKNLVSEAGLYLSTTRETFGIGVLEALAYGVPVVGFDWGGNSEIVKQGVTGYLAPPGDYQALSECIALAFEHRSILSENAIADVRENWTWEPRIKQYADIFKRVHEKYNAKDKPKASIVVTTYKLDKYLPACLDSVMRQTFQDYECLVIDDANMESTKKIVGDYEKRNSRIRYMATPNNLGLPGARNYGVAVSKGRYVRHLDADDFLSDNALELEVAGLDGDRSVDIIYGHLEVVNEDGSEHLENGKKIRGGWPTPKFNWYEQMAHMNQLPSCSMARREVYERSGGYRERMKRQEDAEFWCRVTSLGFRAKKFTEAVTYYHRHREDSKGGMEWKEKGGEPDWTAWFPWRMGASNFSQAQEVLRKRGEVPPNTHIVPFGAQGPAPKDLAFWYVHDFAYPVVSVIVTCGPGHKKYLIDALDSIQAQSYPDWECVVVNDTGEPWPKDIMGAPWAKVVNMDGNRGASATRNEGLKHTKGKFVVWMDADDYWVPWFLEKMVHHGEYNSGIIFSDIVVNDNEKFRVSKYRPDFDSRYVIKDYQYSGSSILVPRLIADAVVNLQGGWDEQIPGQEDWDYQIAVHHLGFCAFHIQEPLFVYRTHTSTKREKDHDKIEEIVAYVDRKWAVYRTGDKQIMCGCNATKAPPGNMPLSLLSSSGNFSQESIQSVINDGNKTQMVSVEYTGPVTGPFSIASRVDRNKIYRFANTDFHRVKTVYLDDATYLVGLGNYRIVGITEPQNFLNPVDFIGQPIEA